jgi:hypothetical protein
MIFFLPDLEKILIICLNETHLKPKHEFKMINFKIFRKDRKDRRKGGVAVAISNEINAKLVVFIKEK